MLSLSVSALLPARCWGGWESRRSAAGGGCPIPLSCPHTTVAAVGDRRGGGCRFEEEARGAEREDMEEASERAEREEPGAALLPLHVRLRPPHRSRPLSSLHALASHRPSPSPCPSPPPSPGAAFLLIAYPRQPARELEEKGRIVGTERERRRRCRRAVLLLG